MGTPSGRAVPERCVKINHSLGIAGLGGGDDVYRAFHVGTRIFEPLGRILVGRRGVYDVGWEKISE